MGNYLNNNYIGFSVVYGIAGLFLKTYTIKQNVINFVPENIEYYPIKDSIDFKTAKNILRLANKGKPILKSILE